MNPFALTRLRQHQRPSIGATRAMAILVTVATLVVTPQGALASPGDTDPSFGEGGRVNTDFLGNNDLAYGVAVQPDGKIVVGGYAAKQAADASIDFGITRYNADGTLDETFGSGGRVTTDFGGNVDSVRRVAVQPDGKIVAVGRSKSATLFDVAIARYMPDGTPDVAFGFGGRTTVDVAGGNDVGEDVVVLPGGKLLVGGYALTPTDLDFALLRFTADGRLDSTFDTDGIVLTDFFGLEDAIEDIVVAEDGRIVVAGYAFKTEFRELFAVARYTADGTPDASFGGDGKVAEDVAILRGAAIGVALLPDGGVIAAGGTEGSARDFAIARFASTGDLDTTFGGGGVAFTDFFGFDDHASSVVVAGDKIVAAGAARHTSSSASSDVAVVRYNLDGTLDTGFGDGGKVSVDYFGLQDFAEDVTVDADGNYVVAGGAERSTDLDFGVIRIEGDPPPEPDFALSLPSPSLTVSRGQKGQIEVHVERTGGFAGEVTVTAPNTKPIKVKLTPPSESTTGTALSFNYKIKKKAVLGTHELTFTGSDGTGRSRTATLSLIVQ